MQHRPDRDARSSSHRKQHGREAAPLAAVLVALLCIWAPIPLGSAAPWATAVIVVAIAIATAIHLLTAGARDTPPLGIARHGGPLHVLLLALLAWVALQLVPLPASLLRVLQPLAAQDYAAVFGDARWLRLAVSPFEAGRTLTLWLSYGLLTLLCRDLWSSRKRLVRFAMWIATAGTVQALWALLHHHPQGLAAQATRLTGTFSGSNAFAGYLSLTFLTTIGLLLREWTRNAETRNATGLRHGRHIARVALIAAAILLQLFALLLTISRGAILATSAAMVLLIGGYLLPSRNAQPPAAWKPGILLLLLALWMATGGTLAGVAIRFAGLTQSSSLDGNARWQLWQDAGRLLAAHPLGVGPGGFSDALLRFQSAGHGHHRAYVAHNDWLQLLVELGIPGFLLVLALVIALWRRAQPLFTSAHSASTWLRRAMGAAVLAAALHAFVDFNLTQRPGVAVTVFALLGAAWGPRHRTASAPATSATGASTPPPSPLLLRGTLCLCLALALRSARDGSASWLAESGFSGIGGSPSLYTWLPAPALDPALAGRRLHTALSLSPADPQTALLTALAHQLHFEARVREAVEQNGPALAALPDKERQGAIRRTMRTDELAMHDALAPILRRAVRLAPWNADIHLQLGRTELLRAMRNHGTHAGSVDAAIRELDLAARLAPTDLAILEESCRILSEAWGWASPGPASSTIAVRLRARSRQALELPGVHAAELLAQLRAARIPPDSALRGIPPSVDALLALHALYSNEDRGDEAQRALNALQALLQERGARPMRTLAGEDSQETYAKALAYVTTQRARWDLRRGHWQDYRSLASARREALRHRLEQALTPTLQVDASPTLQRLALHRTMSAMGLDLERRLQLARVELLTGEEREASALFAECAVVMTTEHRPLLERLQQDLAPIPSDSYVRVLADAQLAALNLRHGDAAALLSTLAESPQLPYRFRFHVRRSLARELLLTHQPDPARSILLALASDMPPDRDALQLLVEAGAGDLPLALPGANMPVLQWAADLALPAELGATFRGETVTLAGLRARPATTQTPSPSVVLSTVWQFAGRVRPDLALLVRTQAPNGQIVSSTLCRFHEAQPLAFGNGEPSLLRDIPLEIPIRAPDPNASLHLRLTTASRDVLFRTDEGLAEIIIDNWTQLLLPEHAANQDTRKTFHATGESIKL